MEQMDQKQFDQKVDKTISDNALKLLGLMDSTIKEKPIFNFRETSPNIPIVELVDSILGNEILRQNTPDIKTAADIVSGAKGIAYGARTYVDLSYAFQNIHDTYGMIPKDTRVRIVQAGSDAYMVVSPPATEVKRNEQVQTIQMEPIRFNINLNTANLLINQANRQSDRLSGWDKYQEKQKKKR